jgi:hypothetical protein
VSNGVETQEQAEIKRQKGLERGRKYRKRHRERLLQERRERYKRNSQHFRNQAVARYWRNPDHVRALARASYRRTPKRVTTPEQKIAARDRVRRYRERHKERLRKIDHERLKNDRAYYVARLLRSRVGKAVKKQYAEKAGKTMDLTGCTVMQLLNHLESQFLPGMTWDNYGRKGWHIDHIIPCAAFDLSREDHQRKCFHYANLRPAWSHHNEGRGSRIEGELPLIYRNRKASSSLTPPPGRESATTSR